MNKTMKLKFILLYIILTLTNNFLFPAAVAPVRPKTPQEQLFDYVIN